MKIKKFIDIRFFPLNEIASFDLDWKSVQPYGTVYYSKRNTGLGIRNAFLLPGLPLSCRGGPPLLYTVRDGVAVGRILVPALEFTFVTHFGRLTAREYIACKIIIMQESRMTSLHPQC